MANTVPTSSFPSTIPFTFTELTHRINECQKPNDLQKLRFPSLINDQEPYTYLRFMTAIIPPIRSYKSFNDFDKDQILPLIKKISDLFPQLSKEEENARLVFWQTLKSNENPPTVSSPLTFKGMGKNKDGEIVTSEYTMSQVLSRAAEEFKLTPQERLQSLLKTESSDQHLGLCQNLLNLIIIEKIVMEQIDSLTKLFLSFCDAKKQLMEGKEKVIQLASNHQALVFKLPHDLSSDEFSFLLNLTQFIDCKIDKEGMHIVLLKEIDLDIMSDLVNKISQQSQIQNASFLSLSNKLLIPGKIFKFYKTFEKTSIKLELFIQRSEILQCRLEHALLPCYNNFKAAMFNFISKMKNDPFEDVKIKDQEVEKHFFTLKEIVDFYQTHLSGQEALYEETYKQLYLLIDKQNKKKTALQRYTKSVFALDEYVSGVTLPVNPFKPSIPTFEEKAPKSVSQKVSLEKPTTSLEKPIGIVPTSSSSKKIESNQNVSNNESSTVFNLLQVKELPGKPFPHIFGVRVERWHQHPFGSALPESLFPEYQDISLKQQTRMHIFHSLHPLVDRFLNLAIQSVWKNKDGNDDIWEIIPSEITYGNETHRGVITFCTDPKTKICYHKFFTEMRADKILEGAIKKIFEANDFPDLKLSMQISKSNLTLKPKPVESLNASCIIDPIFGNVIIKDHEKNLTIKLFNSNYVAKKSTKTV